MKHDADDALVRLLRDRADPDPPAGPCLDAETAAAWFDGALTAAQRREAESHASTCARCQALLATMAQVEPVAPLPRRSLLLIRWLAPALVAATALVVWINVARRSADVASVHSGVAPSPAPASAPAPAEAKQKTGAPQTAMDRSIFAAPSATPLEKRSATAAVEESASNAKEPSRKAIDTRSKMSETAAPRNERETGAAAETVPLTANRQAQLKDEANRVLQRDALAASPAAPPIVRSPDGTLWRIAGDGTVSRSDDNGTTWRDQSPGASTSAHLLAGSSPSPNVVWFAGAGGIIVVTIDGAAWQWRSLPERVDVTGIAAVDGQTATATTRDGRRFVTHDGGLTWVPAAVQENSAAPF